MPIRRNVLIALIIVMLGVLVFFGFLIYSEKNKNLNNPISKKSNEILQTESKKDYPADLQGEIFMTLRKKGIDGNEIFSFDFKDGLLKKVYTPTHPCTLLGGEINAEGTKMVTSSNCRGEDSKVFQIYSSNINKESVAITKSITDLKKEAVWSPDSKKVAFMVASPEERDNPDPGFDISTWNIFTSDLEGNEQFVGNGVHPFFSPDGKKILALREEGLYLFDLETGKGERIHIFNTIVSASTQLDVSDQKDRLAVSNSIDRTITIFKIKAWDTFAMEEIQTIEAKNSYVSWPKFAPNNQKYLITEELFDDQSVKLVAYNLETNKKHLITDLSAYEHSALWINDWK